MTTLRVAGICPESVVDGPGLRFVVFLQGCGHHCPGCHNPETWDPSGGKEMTIEEILAEWDKYSEISTGITISGGEPLDQAKPLLDLLMTFLERYRNKSIVLYTGYVFEGLKKDHDRMMCIVCADYLIDGPFKQELRKELPFRGSSNQRVIDLRATIRGYDTIEVYKQ